MESMHSLIQRYLPFVVVFSGCLAWAVTFAGLVDSRINRSALARSSD